MIKYIIIFLLILLSIIFVIRLFSHFSKQKSYLELSIALITLVLTIYSIAVPKWNEHQHKRYLYQGVIDEKEKNMTVLEKINSKSSSIEANQVQLNTAMIRQFIKEDGPKITNVYLLNKLISDIDLYNQISINIQHYRYASDLENIDQNMMQQVVLSKNIYREYMEYDLEEFANNLSHVEIINNNNLISGPACKI